MGAEDGRRAVQFAPVRKPNLHEAQIKRPAISKPIRAAARRTKNKKKERKKEKRKKKKRETAFGFSHYEIHGWRSIKLGS